MFWGLLFLCALGVHAETEGYGADDAPPLLPPGIGETAAEGPTGDLAPADDSELADEGPADEGPADEGPTDEGPADEGPTDEAPTDEAPTGKADPGEEGPAEEGPAGYADPVDEGPADDTKEPSEEGPAEDEEPADDYMETPEAPIGAPDAEKPTAVDAPAPGGGAPAEDAQSDDGSAPAGDEGAAPAETVVPKIQPTFITTSPATRASLAEMKYRGSRNKEGFRSK